MQEKYNELEYIDYFEITLTNIEKFLDQKLKQDRLGLMAIKMINFIEANLKIKIERI